MTLKIIKQPAKKDMNFDDKNPRPNTSWAPHRIYNVGHGDPISILKFVEILEGYLNIKAKKILKPMQAGDIQATYADITSIEDFIGKTKKTSLEKGLKAFVNWYKNYNF